MTRGQGGLFAAQPGLLVIPPCRFLQSAPSLIEAHDVRFVFLDLARLPHPGRPLVTPLVGTAAIPESNDGGFDFHGYREDTRLPWRVPSSGPPRGLPGTRNSRRRWWMASPGDLNRAALGGYSHVDAFVPTSLDLWRQAILSLDSAGIVVPPGPLQLPSGQLSVSPS